MRQESMRRNASLDRAEYPRGAQERDQHNAKRTEPSGSGARAVSRRSVVLRHREARIVFRFVETHVVVVTISSSHAYSNRYRLEPRAAQRQIGGAPYQSMRVGSKRWLILI